MFVCGGGAATHCRKTVRSRVAARCKPLQRRQLRGGRSGCSIQHTRVRMESFLSAAAARSAAAAMPSTTGSSVSGSWTARALALAMASHPRLGASAELSVSRVAASRDLLLAIFRHVTLTVPDDAPTLCSALRMAVPWQRILLRRGEYLVSSLDSDHPGSSVLRLRSPVHVVGEPGTIVRGTLIFEASCAGGSLSDLRIDDGGDCCIRCHGGTYELSRLRLRCSHGAALLADGSAQATLTDCVLGGESEQEVGRHVMISAYGSLQVQGGAKRACYGVVCRDDASVLARTCSLRECSEAAALLAHRARLQLWGCHISACPAAAFMAGQGRGRLLELTGCTLEGIPERRLWADADRPRAFVWGDGNHWLKLLSKQRGSGDEEDDEENDDGDDDDDALDDTRMSLLPPPERRGAGSEDSDSDSLEDEEFADMERLMEELDQAALQEAQLQR